MIKNLIALSLSCGLVSPAYSERTDHDEYNERTSWLIGQIQRMTDADRIEALAYESDNIIEQFCRDNNYNTEDIKNVLH